MCKAITASGERCRLSKKKDWCHIHEVALVKEEMSTKIQIAKDVMNASIADTKQLSTENEELRRTVATLERNMGIKVSEQAAMISLLETELANTMKAKKVVPIRHAPKSAIDSQELINKQRDTIERLENDLEQVKGELETRTNHYKSMVAALQTQVNEMRAKVRPLDIVIEFERLKQDLDNKQIDFFDRDYKYHSLRKARNYIVHSGILHN